MPEISEKKKSKKDATPHGAFSERVKQFNEHVWSLESLNDRSIRGRLNALYRVLSITIKGCLQNKIPMQSAALTYYSLMSLGPVIALALIISGFILKKEGSQGEVQFKAAIVRVIQEVVPQTTVQTNLTPEETLIAELAGIDTSADLATGEEPTAKEQAESLKDISQTLDQLIDRLINNAANGKAGAVGIAILLLLAVLMISRVENTFNSIWNVQFGRTWKDRFINYFVFIVLAFLFGAASLTMVSASSIAKSVAKSEDALVGDAGMLSFLPDWLVGFLQGGAPIVISIALLTVLTTFLNKFMPNARVHWRAAFLGGLVAALIIIGNQKLAALYVSKVVSFQNLYGELSIVLILMFGMYLTWLFLLIGGQVTYAFQNVRFLADHRTWESLSSRVRHTLCFACLLIAARRFKNEKPGPTAEELSDILHVQGSIISECLGHLVAVKLLSPVIENHRKETIIRYQPARPLAQMSLGSVKEILETHVGKIRLELIADCDPALPYFGKAFAQFQEIPDAKLTLDELLRKTAK